MGLNDCFWLKVETQKERTDGAASEKTDNDLHLDGSQLAFDGPEKLFQHHKPPPSPFTSDFEGQKAFKPHALAILRSAACS